MVIYAIVEESNCTLRNSVLHELVSTPRHLDWNFQRGVRVGTGKEDGVRYKRRECGRSGGSNCDKCYNLLYPDAKLGGIG